MGYHKGSDTDGRLGISSSFLPGRSPSEFRVRLGSCRTVAGANKQKSKN